MNSTDFIVIAFFILVFMAYRELIKKSDNISTLKKVGFFISILLISAISGFFLSLFITDTIGIIPTAENIAIFTYVFGGMVALIIHLIIHNSNLPYNGTYFHPPHNTT